MRIGRGPNVRELQRYLSRVGDRWPLQTAVLGGARVADLLGGVADPALPRGPEFVMLLVSDGFAGLPWLERVHQASALWDVLEMGDPAEIHCFTAEEYVRRRQSAPAIRAIAERGLLLFADSEPFAGDRLT